MYFARGDHRKKSQRWVRGLAGISSNRQSVVFLCIQCYKTLVRSPKHKVDFFYHVTTGKLQEIFIFDKSCILFWLDTGRTSIEKEKCLRANLPNDRKYDKGLLDLQIEGVFGNTNLFKNKLPTITQYPRDGLPKKLFPRIKLSLTELQLHTDMYDMFFVWKEGLQQLVAFFPNDHPKIEEIRLRLHLLNKNDNKILQYKDGSWQCPQYENKESGMFTNVFISGPIALDKFQVDWDTVTRQ